MEVDSPFQILSNIVYMSLRRRRWRKQLLLHLHILQQRGQAVILHISVRQWGEEDNLSVGQREEEDNLCVRQWEEEDNLSVRQREEKDHLYFRQRRTDSGVI